MNDKNKSLLHRDLKPENVMFKKLEFYNNNNELES